MIESTSAWLDRLGEIAAHAMLVKVSWTDDGVTLLCERDECIEDGYWWQREYDGIPYPEDLVNMRDLHLLGGI